MERSAVSKLHRKLAVLYVSHYTHMRMGGQQSMIALIERLDRAFVTPYALAPGPGELADKLKELNTPVAHLPLGSIKPKRIFSIIAAIRGVRTMCKRDAIDIVHPDSERDAFVCGLAIRGLPTKMIWHVRLTLSNGLDPFIVRLADGIIGISEGVRHRFDHFPKIDEKYQTIYNGVDCKRFSPTTERVQLRKRLDLPRDRFVLLFVGQFKRGKGILELAHAMALLKQRMHPDKLPLLLMIGAPNDSTAIREFQTIVERSELGENVRCLPQQREIYRWMQAADAIVLPSHEGAEGMGRVLFEGMACGAVAIGSDVSGVREALSPESGLLTLEKSPESIADAIEKLALDSALKERLRQGAIQRARTTFDIRLHAKAVQNFYKSMLASTAS